MELRFRISARIARPVADVFAAVVEPDRLSAYFTTGGARGRLEPGATVTWDFQDHPGAFPVEVVEVVRNERIVLQWGASEAEPAGGPEVDAEATAHYHTTVTMLFTPLEDGRIRWWRSPKKAGASPTAACARLTTIARAGRRCCAR